MAINSGFMKASIDLAHRCSTCFEEVASFKEKTTMKNDSCNRAIEALSAPNSSSRANNHLSQVENNRQYIGLF